MNSLASTYPNQGRWEEAEELQVMETSSRVLGLEHPDTLVSMNNLASTYRNQGRWKEAEKLFVQVMETTPFVGDPHPWMTLPPHPWILVSSMDECAVSSHIPFHPSHHGRIHQPEKNLMNYLTNPTDR